MMGLWSKIKAAAADLWANSSGWVPFGIGGGGWIDGEPVNDKSAMTVAAYFACIRNVAQDSSKVPYRSLRNEETKRVRVEDSLDYIFNVAFNPCVTAYQGRSTLIQWVKGWGRAYAEVVRDGMGNVRELWPIHPSRVQVKWLDSKTRIFCVHNDDGTVSELRQREVFHIYGEGDGYEGYSVCKLMTNTLGLALNTQNLANKFFANGAMPGGVLETDQTLKPEARETLRRSWQEKWGGPENAGKTPVLEAGIKYKTVSLPFKDLQMLEVRKFQTEEIARWFRMPLHKLQVQGSAKGWATVDATETEYVNDCLLPLNVNFEQEIKRQLMGNEGEYADVYAHFEMKGLLRGAIRDRMQYYKDMFFMGAITPNEIRRLEDMDEIDAPEMNQTYIQGATVPLALAGMLKQNGVDPTSPKNPNEPEPAEPEPKEDDDGKESESE